MTLPATPPITLEQVCAEFLAPIGTPLNAFVRGGAYVPNTAQNAGVPTAPPIVLNQLCNAVRYVPMSLSGPTAISWDGSAAKPPRKFYTDSGQVVSGGNDSKTYSWAYLNGSQSIYCDAPSTLAASFWAYGGYLQTTTPTVTNKANWRLTINDGTAVITRDYLLTFTSYGNE